jgi:O-antigen ligase
VKDLICLTAILLVPLAVEMTYEKITVHNLFSIIGGVAETPQIRSGNVRAQGPFAHAILAGTIGAVCLPLMIGLWHQHRKFSVVGISACLVVVFCSSSSGPIMSALVAVGAMAMWPYRHSMRAIRWLAIIGYLALEIVMKAPAYYLIARVDVAGGSTGWHRARLIQSALEHIDEWWLAGTDFTRHWMPTGVSWSSDHTDITNHYLQMGVIGGLPLMLLFIGMLYQGFSLVGKRLQQEDQPHEVQFFMWAIGASLFAHMATSISVSYFDQSFVFIYLTLAATGSLAVMDDSDLVNGEDTKTSSEQPI